MRLDVAVESEVAGVIREIVSRHGRLDCAVNCAGYDVAHALTEFSEADYDAIFNANVKGLFFCLKHEILAMRGKGGAIVNVGSVAAQMSDLGNSLYNASKAAAHSLNRTAATEAAKNGVRVNEVAPGPTATPMLEGFLRAAADAGSAFNSASIVANVPLGRIGTPDELANTVLFLCSDEASFITGASPHRGWRLPARLGRDRGSPVGRQRHVPRLPLTVGALIEKRGLNPFILRWPRSGPRRMRH